MVSPLLVTKLHLPLPRLPGVERKHLLEKCLTKLNAARRAINLEWTDQAHGS
jgi:hypothetical protein